MISFERGWISKEDYENIRYQFIGESLRLIKLKVVKIVPIKVKKLILA